MNRNIDPGNAARHQDAPDAGRRNLLKLTGAGVAAFGAASFLKTPNAKAQNMSQKWDKVFPKSEKVDHQKVTFRNRYGITLAGDLYLPKDRADSRLPAIVVSGPFGAVKEQSSGLYAQTMAERGFITLAFDPSFTGESGGEPRNVASPGPPEKLGAIPPISTEELRSDTRRCTAAPVQCQTHSTGRWASATSSALRFAVSKPSAMKRWAWRASATLSSQRLRQIAVFKERSLSTMVVEKDSKVT